MAKQFPLWTARDVDILETLALKVRMLTLSHLASIWWKPGVNLTTVRQRLRQLRRAGLLACYTLNVHPLLSLDAPLFIWSPGSSEPNSDQLANNCTARWGRATEPTTIYLATALTRNLFASYGTGELANRLFWDHDLHLGQVYYRYRTERPSDAAQWIGEDAFRTAGYRIKEPDAFLRDEAGKLSRVVEFAGRYDAERIRKFHDHCEKRCLNYELW